MNKIKIIITVSLVFFFLKSNSQTIYDPYYETNAPGIVNFDEVIINKDNSIHLKISTNGNWRTGGFKSNLSFSGVYGKNGNSITLDIKDTEFNIHTPLQFELHVVDPSRKVEQRPNLANGYSRGTMVNLGKNIIITNFYCISKQKINFLKIFKEQENEIKVAQKIDYGVNKPNFYDDRFKNRYFKVKKLLEKNKISKADKLLEKMAEAKYYYDYNRFQKQFLRDYYFLKGKKILNKSNLSLALKYFTKAKNIYAKNINFAKTKPQDNSSFTFIDLKINDVYLKMYNKNHDIEEVKKIYKIYKKYNLFDRITNQNIFFDIVFEEHKNDKNNKTVNYLLANFKKEGTILNKLKLYRENLGYKVKINSLNIDEYVRVLRSIDYFNIDLYNELRTDCIEWKRQKTVFRNNAKNYDAKLGIDNKTGELIIAITPNYHILKLETYSNKGSYDLDEVSKEKYLYDVIDKSCLNTVKYDFFKRKLIGGIINIHDHDFLKNKKLKVKLFHHERYYGTNEIIPIFDYDISNAIEKIKDSISVVVKKSIGKIYKFKNKETDKNYLNINNINIPEDYAILNKFKGVPFRELTTNGTYYDGEKVNNYAILTSINNIPVSINNYKKIIDTEIKKTGFIKLIYYIRSKDNDGILTPEKKECIFKFNNSNTEISLKLIDLITLPINNNITSIDNVYFNKINKSLFLFLDMYNRDDDNLFVISDLNKFSYYGKFKGDVKVIKGKGFKLGNNLLKFDSHGSIDKDYFKNGMKYKLYKKDGSTKIVYKDGRKVKDKTGMVIGYANDMNLSPVDNLVNFNSVKDKLNGKKYIGNYQHSDYNIYFKYNKEPELTLNNEFLNILAQKSAILFNIDGYLGIAILTNLNNIRIYKTNIEVTN